MKRFYKTMALVSLFGLGISNLFCGESVGAEAGYEAEARRLDCAQMGYDAEAIREAQAKQEIDQLFAAVEREDYGEFNRLISDSENKDVLVNAKDKYGLTPLHWATAREHTEVVKILLAAGADTEATNNIGWTPLHYAASWGFTEVVEILLNAGANKEAKSSVTEFTPLHLAAYGGHTEIVEILIKARANIEARNIDGHTPLHIATYNDYIKVVQVLLAARADREVEDLQKRKPRDLACSKNVWMVLYPKIHF
jgi:ankyrin repeat protein